MQEVQAVFLRFHIQTNHIGIMQNADIVLNRTCLESDYQNSLPAPSVTDTVSWPGLSSRELDALVITFWSRHVTVHLTEHVASKQLKKCVVESEE